MNCVSRDICVYHLGLFVFFPGVFLSSRVTGACPATTDLNILMRVNVRTTTTIQNIFGALSGFVWSLEDTVTSNTSTIYIVNVAVAVVLA